MDYFSKYPEVMPVESKTAESAVEKVKTVFARHGIPETFIADNMLFNSRTFRKFKAERFVQIIKQLFKKAKEDEKDLYLTLLELRNTPITGLMFSPLQLLLSRRHRNLHMTEDLLQPEMAKGLMMYSLKDKDQKVFHDRTAKVRPDLKPNDMRYHTDSGWRPAIISGKHETPRSDMIE